MTDKKRHSFGRSLCSFTLQEYSIDPENDASRSSHVGNGNPNQGRVRSSFSTHVFTGNLSKERSVADAFEFDPVAWMPFQEKNPMAGVGMTVEYIEMIQAHTGPCHRM